ncbi:hypothetical protein MOQ72_37275 [Saccharopolyspora sp. K220]|uniref:hypothetical protein n=1 Tax=Saccharopolyspora soli TaxID=2926618 RepID=UPI001F585D6D|nr:hypothetical protein [Saccharopolyspora soli]MCI2423085.1 hypothetical protein [Saccharopolyspora soli]
MADTNKPSLGQHPEYETIEDAAVADSRPGAADMTWSDRVRAGLQVSRIEDFGREIPDRPAKQVTHSVAWWSRTGSQE